MKEPVLASDGRTYDRKAIEAVLARPVVQRLSPATHAPLQTTLHPNVALSQRLEAHLARLQWAAEQAELSAQAEAQATAEAAPAPPPEAAPPAFEVARSFLGRRPGTVFKLGEHGLGYYRDPLSTQLAATRRGVKRPAEEATAQ